VQGNNLVGRVQREREADARQVICHLQDARDDADRGHGHCRATHAEAARVCHHLDRRPHFVVIVQGLLSVCRELHIRARDQDGYADKCQQGSQAVDCYKQVKGPSTLQSKAAHPHAHEDYISNGREGPRMYQLLDDLS
jgi:hypothetical protein